MRGKKTCSMLVYDTWVNLNAMFGRGERKNNICIGIKNGIIQFMASKNILTWPTLDIVLLGSTEEQY